MKTGVYEWTEGGKCSECGKPFEGLHLVSKTTCGPKCRKRRERRQKDARAASYAVIYELGKIRDSLKRDEDVEFFKAQLLRLKGEINDLLVLARDDDAMARMLMLNDRAAKKRSL